jgi:hypothetical protein
MEIAAKADGESWEGHGIPLEKRDFFKARVRR